MYRKILKLHTFNLGCMQAVSVLLTAHSSVLGAAKNMIKLKELFMNCLLCEIKSKQF